MISSAGRVGRDRQGPTQGDRRPDRRSHRRGPVVYRPAAAVRQMSLHFSVGWLCARPPLTKTSHALISAVAPIPQQQVDDALAQLVRAELIFSRETPPDAEYTAKPTQRLGFETLVMLGVGGAESQLANRRGLGQRGT